MDKFRIHYKVQDVVSDYNACTKCNKLAIKSYNNFTLLYVTLTEQKARRTRVRTTPKPSASPIPVEIELPDDETCEGIPQGFGNGW